jgi:hypothetical protein
MELMTKRPEYFTVRRFQQAKLRGQVFHLYMSLLKAQPSAESRQMRNPTLISVVGPLVQFVKSLKPYALHTRAISRYAQNVRHVLQHARDPFDLLYVDLPRAVDLPTFEETEKLSDDNLTLFRERFAKAVIELRQAYPKLIDSIKQIVLHAFSDGEDITRLRAHLKQRASNLLERSSDPQLKPFLAALTNFAGIDQDWLVSVATIVSQRSVDSWRESDLQGFAPRMRDFAKRFAALEVLIARTERASRSRRQPGVTSRLSCKLKFSSQIV